MYRVYLSAMVCVEVEALDSDAAKRCSEIYLREVLKPKGQVASADLMAIEIQEFEND